MRAGFTGIAPESAVLEPQGEAQCVVQPPQLRAAKDPDPFDQISTAAQASQHSQSAIE
jgi:hypothetical protein